MSVWQRHRTHRQTVGRCVFKLVRTCHGLSSWRVQHYVSCSPRWCLVYDASLGIQLLRTFHTGNLSHSFKFEDRSRDLIVVPYMNWRFYNSLCCSTINSTQLKIFICPQELAGVPEKQRCNQPKAYSSAMLAFLHLVPNSMTWPILGRFFRAYHNANMRFSLYMSTYYPLLAWYSFPGNNSNRYHKLVPNDH